jgi:hypothetical protein
MEPFQSKSYFVYIPNEHILISEVLMETKVCMTPSYELEFHHDRLSDFL